MPIYEFRCQDCNALFEAIVTSASAVDTVTCNKCQSNNIRKTISAGSYRINKDSSLPTGALTGCSGKSGFS